MPGRVGRCRRRTHAGEEGLDAGRFGGLSGHNSGATGAGVGAAGGVAIDTHVAGEECDCFRSPGRFRFSSRRFGLASFQSRLGYRSSARVSKDERQSGISHGSRVVFYGLLAVFPAITAFVSLYGLMADPSTIHERLSLGTGILPQGTLNILNEQLTRLTSHRTSALSVGFIGGLLVALWSANAGTKAIMDALNVALRRN
jgi:hypothetical protein